MSESLETLKQLIEASSPEVRKELFLFLKAKVSPHPLEVEWGIDGDDVLSSIHRATDLSRRGVRGLIAEFMFSQNILPSVQKNGWTEVALPKGDWPYDCQIERDGKNVNIQIKLQRLDKGLPKRFWPSKYTQLLYDVEVQKTRTGQKRTRKDSDALLKQVEEAVEAVKDTRPYEFGAFDILAVNMQPSTGAWANFRFTVANWLLPRPDQPSLMAIHQPVALDPDDLWTDDLSTCLGWFLTGEKRQVLREIKHITISRKKKK